MTVKVSAKSSSYKIEINELITLITCAKANEIHLTYYKLFLKIFNPLDILTEVLRLTRENSYSDLYNWQFTPTV